MPEIHKKKLTQRPLRPERILALGFLVLILLGTALLSLPAAAQNGKSIGFFNSLFTATSAVCVTGLVAVDTGTTFSAFGQAVLLLLIQVGGLGFMVFATVGMLALGQKLSLKSRVLMRESMNVATLSGLGRLTLIYGCLAFGIELFGAVLFSIRFIPLYGTLKGIWYGLFHAVSAFCNAGFDLFGNYNSLTGFHDDPLVIVTACLMIILGSMGFAVIWDLCTNRKGWNGLSLQTRLVLPVTAVLLAVGTVFYAVLEWNNPDTMGKDSVPVKLMGAFFQSVTMRTAGFNSIDLAAMTDGSKMISCLLMFIGASPASTGGGVKTTTIAILLLTVWSVIRGRDDVTIMKKRMPTELLRRALALVTISLSVLLVTTLAITVAENGQTPFTDILFEMSSAVATVGVSAKGTPNMAMASRTIIIFVMYFGRVGPLTLAMALARKSGSQTGNIRYPEGEVMIG